MLKNIENFFSQLIIFATSIFSDQDIIISHIVIPSYAIKFTILIIIAFVFHFIIVKLFLPIIEKIFKKTKTKFDDIFHEKKLIRRALHIIPAAIISIGLPLIVNRELESYSLIIKGVRIYYILITLAIYDALLNSFREIYDERTKSKKVGITGIIQALKVLGIIIAFILAISVLAGKSPVYFLSGLGAFTAVLMLIFRDPILGLVAGVQLSAMDLVRKGDWIEIPKHGADGQVVDITLTTVQVRNWDMTFTAIPAYELITFSFKNWRGMFESGGRRIKRSMRFSVKSIRFLLEEEVENLRKIKLLKNYIDSKWEEINDFNATAFSTTDLSMQTNGRRLTNIGTYRAYCNAYLREHPGINKNMILLVRQLHPTEFGLPLEIYAYTSDVTWIGHEDTQSDIFDHLLAIIPEFGLELYQR